MWSAAIAAASQRQPMLMRVVEGQRLLIVFDKPPGTGVGIYLAPDSADLSAMLAALGARVG